MRNYLRTFNLLTEHEIDLLESKVQNIKLKKGDFFIKENRVSKEVAFVVSGLFRSFYYSSSEEEVTYCFTFSNSFVSAYSSFLSQTKTIENIQALTDIELLTISREDILILEKSSTNWLKFFKLITEQEYIKMEKRVLLLQKESAEKIVHPNIQGEPIPTVGYHGMRSYNLAFEDVFVPDEGLLGGEENKGFYQLMVSYESARLQTAARAVGVATAAFDFALQYSKEREQFGKPICEHQAIRMKLSEMKVELEAARQLTYYAASLKDSGKRCDLEAGMAKVKAAKAVEFITREAMQILGGYGYSKEFPVERYWRDGRVISIFEGTSEIQHEVIAKAILK